MALTSTQLTALAADIVADPVLSLLAHTADNAFEVALAYNLPDSPDFYVWRTSIPKMEVSEVLVWAEMLTLSSVDLTVFQIMTGDNLNSSNVNVRQGLQDIFAGPQRAGTRNALVLLSKRLATRVEALFAVGTGSLASPATMAYEGAISYQDVLAAWGV